MRKSDQELLLRWANRSCSPALISQILLPHIHTYFSGLTSRESLQHLVDELLYASFQKKDETISSLLFATLTCAADPPSTHEKLMVWHRKLRKHLQHLKQYEQEDT